MRFFGRRAAELERRNRHLIEIDKLRAARVESLEGQVVPLKQRVSQLESENRELAERNRLLTDAATRYSFWGQELDRLLCEANVGEEERRIAWSKFVKQLGVKYLNSQTKTRIDE